MQVAVRFNMKPALAHKLLKAAKSGSMLKERLQKRETTKTETHHLILSAVIDFEKRGASIWKAAQIQAFIQANSGKTVSLSEIRQMLKHTLQYKYRVVKRVPFQGNLNRAVIMRQIYGKFMLELLSDTTKTVLCID